MSSYTSDSEASSCSLPSSRLPTSPSPSSEEVIHLTESQQKSTVATPGADNVISSDRPAVTALECERNAQPRVKQSSRSPSKHASSGISTKATKLKNTKPRHRTLKTTENKVKLAKQSVHQKVKGDTLSDPETKQHQQRTCRKVKPFKWLTRKQPLPKSIAGEPAISSSSESENCIVSTARKIDRNSMSGGAPWQVEGFNAQNGNQVQFYNPNQFATGGTKAGDQQHNSATGAESGRYGDWQQQQGYQNGFFQQQPGYYAQDVNQQWQDGYVQSAQPAGAQPGGYEGAQAQAMPGHDWGNVDPQQHQYWDNNTYDYGYQHHYGDASTMSSQPNAVDPNSSGGPFGNFQESAEDAEVQAYTSGLSTQTGAAQPHGIQQPEQMEDVPLDDEPAASGQQLPQQEGELHLTSPESFPSLSAKADPFADLSANQDHMPAWPQAPLAHQRLLQTQQGSSAVHSRQSSYGGNVQFILGGSEAGSTDNSLPNSPAPAGKQHQARDSHNTSVDCLSSAQRPQQHNQQHCQQQHDTWNWNQQHQPYAEQQQAPKYAEQHHTGQQHAQQHAGQQPAQQHAGQQHAQQHAGQQHAQQHAGQQHVGQHLQHQHAGQQQHGEQPQQQLHSSSNSSGWEATGQQQDVAADDWGWGQEEDVDEMLQQHEQQQPLADAFSNDSSWSMQAQEAHPQAQTGTPQAPGQPGVAQPDQVVPEAAGEGSSRQDTAVDNAVAPDDAWPDMLDSGNNAGEVPHLSQNLSYEGQPMDSTRVNPGPAVYQRSPSQGSQHSSHSFASSDVPAFKDRSFSNASTTSTHSTQSAHHLPAWSANQNTSHAMPPAMSTNQDTPHTDPPAVSTKQFASHAMPPAISANQNPLEPGLSSAPPGPPPPNSGSSGGSNPFRRGPGGNRLTAAMDNTSPAGASNTPPASLPFQGDVQSSSVQPPDQSLISPIQPHPESPFQPPVKTTDSGQLEQDHMSPPQPRTPQSHMRSRRGSTPRHTGRDATMSPATTLWANPEVTIGQNVRLFSPSLERQSSGKSDTSHCSSMGAGPLLSPRAAVSIQAGITPIQLSQTSPDSNILLGQHQLSNTTKPPTTHGTPQNLSTPQNHPNTPLNESVNLQTHSSAPTMGTPQEHFPLPQEQLSITHPSAPPNVHDVGAGNTPNENVTTSQNELQRQQQGQFSNPQQNDSKVNKEQGEGMQQNLQMGYTQNPSQMNSRPSQDNESINQSSLGYQNVTNDLQDSLSENHKPNSNIPSSHYQIGLVQTSQPQSTQVSQHQDSEFNNPENQCGPLQQNHYGEMQNHGAQQNRGSQKNQGVWQNQVQQHNLAQQNQYGPPNQYGSPQNQGTQQGHREPPTNQGYQYGTLQNQGPQQNQYGPPQNQGSQQNQYGPPQNQGSHQKQYGLPQNQESQQDQYKAPQNQGSQQNQYGLPQNQGSQQNQYGFPQSQQNPHWSPQNQQGPQQTMYSSPHQQNFQQSQYGPPQNQEGPQQFGSPHKQQGPQQFGSPQKQLPQQTSQPNLVVNPQQNQSYPNQVDGELNYNQTLSIQQNQSFVSNQPQAQPSPFQGQGQLEGQVQVTQGQGYDISNQQPPKQEVPSQPPVRFPGQRVPPGANAPRKTNSKHGDDTQEGLNRSASMTDTERYNQYYRDPRYREYYSDPRYAGYEQYYRPSSRGSYQDDYYRDYRDRQYERPRSRQGYQEDPDRPHSITGYERPRSRQGYPDGDNPHSRPPSRQGEENVSQTGSRPSSRAGIDSTERPRSRTNYDRDSYRDYRDRRDPYNRSRSYQDFYDYYGRDYYADYYDYYGYKRDERYSRGYYDEMRSYGQDLPDYDRRSNSQGTYEDYERRSQRSSRSTTPSLETGADQFAREFHQGSRPGSRNSNYEQSPIYPVDKTRPDYHDQSYGYDARYNYRNDPRYDPRYDRNDPRYDPRYDYYRHEQTAPARMTPVKFSIPHLRAAFGPGGQLVQVLATNPADGQPARVTIQDAHEIMIDTGLQEEFKLFPGPLVKGDTHKNDVLLFCQKKIQECKENVELLDQESVILLWQYLSLLIKQNGTVLGTDVCDLLLEGHEPSTAEFAVTGMSISWSGADLKEIHDTEVTTDRSLISRALSSNEVTDRFRNLLLRGRKKDALEWAIKNNLWGHALFLASKMDTKTHASVMTRFANVSMKINDPLQTLYQLMSGRQPAAVTLMSEEKWGDWRPHLAMILGNPTQRPDIDRKSVINLGDTLAGKGLLYASHFCYLMAQVPFGHFHKKSSKFVLIGSSHVLDFDLFATNEAIQCTEVFEYAISLGNPLFSLPTLQTYKLLYAYRLAENSMHEEALRYCEVLGTTICQNPVLYQGQMVQQTYDLACRLKYYDPERLQASEDDHTDPSWLSNLDRVVKGFKDGSIQSLSGSQTPMGYGTTGSSEAGDTSYAQYVDSSQYLQQQYWQHYDPSQQNVYTQQWTQQPGTENITQADQSQPAQGQVDQAHTDQGQGDQPHTEQAWQQQPANEEQQQQQQQQAQWAGWDASQMQAWQQQYAADGSYLGYQSQQQQQQQHQTPEEALPAQEDNQQQTERRRRTSTLSYDDTADNNVNLASSMNSNYTTTTSDTATDETEEDSQPATPTPDIKESFDYYAATNNKAANSRPIQLPPVAAMSTMALYSPSPESPKTLTPSTPTSLPNIHQTSPNPALFKFGVPPPPSTNYTSSAPNVPLGASGSQQTLAQLARQHQAPSGGPQANNAAPQQSAQQNYNKNRGGGKSWFGGIISKMIPKGKNEMILPDDKNPAIVWDPVAKRWMNTDKSEEELQKSAAPPPKDMDLMGGAPAAAPMRPSAAATPAGAPPSSGNRFSRQKTWGARGKYVDVLASSSSKPSPVAPAHLFNVLPPVPGAVTTPSNIFVPSGGQSETEAASQPQGPVQDDENLSRSSSMSSLSQEVQNIMQGPADNGQAVSQTEAPPAAAAAPPPGLPMMFNPTQFTAPQPAPASGRMKYGQRRAYPK